MPAWHCDHRAYITDPMAKLLRTAKLYLFIAPHAVQNKILIKCILSHAKILLGSRRLVMAVTQDGVILFDDTISRYPQAFENKVACRKCPACRTDPALPHPYVMQRPYGYRNKTIFLSNTCINSLAPI